ncbi:hypothetical protein SAMN05216167_102808 [Spirosoma endophyticum]|uniref:Uncharacterized protein n=1 Tax=Spirosoma endophyticum TaxID=662367 RepID=A0A1I1N1J8_9BACT|nr:hypothetical protein SAMN05216167_102808 [Spirosoma endophyticum]
MFIDYYPLTKNDMKVTRFEDIIAWQKVQDLAY